MPRIEPKRAASKLGPRLPNFARRATPRAKDAVVTTPIAASEPIRCLRATLLIASAEPTPQTPAPSMYQLEAISWLAANPPKIAWESPCPM